MASRLAASSRVLMRSSAIASLRTSQACSSQVSFVASFNGSSSSTGSNSTLFPRSYSSTSVAHKSAPPDHLKPPAHALLTLEEKVKAPPMVYISGEEMTHYVSDLVVEKWFEPFFDLSAWERYDLSCKNRDETNDKVLHAAVDAGKRVGAIFKEPTITPSAIQQKEMGLKNSLGSPNGAMRKGWNGITISRDTIHIEGIELGYKNPVFFERHAVGGEYGAGWSKVGKGTLLTTYLPSDNSPPFVVDKRDLTDENNVVVVYHNPYDNVAPLAHLFFQRCLKAEITPYIVTKKTVFKWQEGFWEIMKEIFDNEYKEQFLAKGLMERSGNELTHLISDAATMQLIRWTDGGFGMAAHNYDGDMCK